MTLRWYQQEAVDALWDHFRQHKSNPIVVAPTGAGKSHILGAFVASCLEAYRTTRIIVATHVKELVEQDVSKLSAYLGAPVGIHCAGLGKRDIAHPVIVGSVQSLTSKRSIFRLQRTDMVIVDECHLVSPKESGAYKRLFERLRHLQPALKVVGLTATPYRTGDGMLTDGDIFDRIAYDIPVTTLIDEGYLSNVTTRALIERADLNGVRKRGGDYVQSQLQAACIDCGLIDAQARSIAIHAADRQRLIVFCSGVEHAKAVASALRGALGTTGVHTLFGSDPKPVRDARIAAFKRGEFRALVNVSVLTTGFDAPEIDCVVLLRPTCSPGLYVQMVGRGMRIAPGKKDCLVLDYGGNVERHGPIDAVDVTKSGGGGEAPIKVCDRCRAVNPISAKHCRMCFAPFPEPEDGPGKMLATKPGSEAILSTQRTPLRVTSWSFRRHEKPGKPPSVCVRYQIGDSMIGGKTVREWVCPEHGGFASRKAESWWKKHADSDPPQDVSAFLARTGELRMPTEIRTKREGKYERIADRSWD